MSARSETYELMARLGSRGIALGFTEAETLRRAQLTLRRWAEQECGDGNDYASWAIERDETTGRPFMCRYPHQGESSRWPIADRERGALARVKALCDARGLFFYHQSDPRGCALYVSAEPFTSDDYTRGVPCSI